MELNEALERLSRKPYQGEDAIAYLRGLADATPAELEADDESTVENETDHEAIAEQGRLRGWRNRIIKDHGSLSRLGSNAVVRNVDSGALYRASIYGPDRWSDGYGKLSSYGTALQAVSLPAKVIFEGNPL